MLKKFDAMQKRVAQFEKDNHSVANGHTEQTKNKPTSFQMPSQVAQPKRNPNFVMPSAKSQAPQNPIQKKEDSSDSGLPENLQAGMETMSGMDLSDVNVHYNSNKPAQLQALAYAQGNDIHVASGQEKHLPHEAWHVVQQKQGRVQPTTQTNGVPVNDSPSLEKEADLMGAKAVNGQWDAVQMKKKGSSNGSNVSQLLTDVEEREALAIELLSKVEPGMLCTSKDFDKMSHEGALTGAGTAKKRILTELRWFENIFPDVVVGHGKNLKIEHYAFPAIKAIYLEAYKRALLMFYTTQSWISERFGDSSRDKRAIGMFHFLTVIDDFVTQAKSKLPFVFNGKKHSDKEKLANDYEESLEQDEDIKKMKLHYEQRSAKSVFTKMSWLANTLAPTKNSEGECEVNVKFPLAFGGAVFLGGKLHLKVEREEKTVKISCKAGLIVGGEADALLFKLEGQVGFGVYFEAKAADTDKAMTLISYGFYKRLKENSVLGQFADIAWGGSFNASKFETTTENEILSDSASESEDDAPYVEFGGYIEGKAEGKLHSIVGKGGGKLEGDGRMGKRYDKDTTNGKKGKESSSLKFGIEGTFGEFTVGGEYQGKEWLVGDQVQYEETVEISAKSPNVGTAKGKFLALFNSIGAELQKKEDNQKSHNSGTRVNLVTEWGEMMNDKIATASEDKFNSLEQGVKSEGKLGIALSLNLTKKEGSLSLLSVSESEAVVGSGIKVSGKLEKKAKLLTFEYSGGKWGVKSSLVK